MTWFFFASWKEGCWTARYRKHNLSLRAPWCRPLFSERNGYIRVFASCRGWRLLGNHRSHL